MKATSRYGPWRSVLGALALGVCVFSLSLEGAPSNKGRDSAQRDLRSPEKDTASADHVTTRPSPSIDRARASQGKGTLSNEGIRITRDGRMPQGVPIPVAPPVRVNPYDDEPTRLRNSGEIPWGPYLRPRLAVAGGVCQFNIDCDDCNDCTTDFCNIAPFAASGTCLHTNIPNGQGDDECSDGLFCNGIETCQALVCQLGGSGTGIPDDPQDGVPCAGECAGGTSADERCSPPGSACPGGGTCVAAACDEDLNECIIPCSQRVCSQASTERGKTCANDGQCPGGICLTANGVCQERDGNALCTGTDTCDLVTGLCEHSGNPCGPGADCFETTCQNGIACLTDADCTAGTCEVRAAAGCSFGRCCASAGAGEFTCTVKRYQTAPNGVAAARCPANEVWYRTATGSLASGNVECPQCPKYGSGLADNELSCIGGPDDGEACVTGATCDSTQCDRRFGPVTVALGPASDSDCADLYALGDDYDFSNTNQFVAVEELVFIGGVLDGAEERISFEFYSATNEFIEEFFFPSGVGVAVRTVTIDPPVILPPNGRIVARAATAFAPSAQVMWAATDEVDDVNGVPVGANNAASLIVDTTPTLNDLTPVDYAGVCVGGPNDGVYCDAPGDCPGGACDQSNATVPNILAFELAGAKVADPIGACCNQSTGACDGALPWNCIDDNSAPDFTFLGVGQTCASCVGGSNPGGSCRRCLGGGDDDEPCDQHSDCLSGNCALENTDCAGGGICTATAACANGACCSTAGVCSASTGSTCPGGSTFQGFGSTCDPNCCVIPPGGYTGGDNCDDAIVHVANVPCITDADCIPNGDCRLDSDYGSNVCYFTITGNNNPATGPDSCTAAQFDPQETQDVTTVDPGWWEALSVDDCAFVRFDMCCTNPVHAPQWVVMWDSCPCEQLGAVSYFNSENPNIFDGDDPRAANNRGAPFCAEDNLWWQYGPLPGPFTYYQPIYSSLAGHHGVYQMHMVVAACPKAATCYNACSNSTNTACTSDANCPADHDCVADTSGAARTCKKICDRNNDCSPGTCQPLCGLMHILDAEDIDGIFLGPPNKAIATTFCSGALCSTGSCCPGPGQCVDEEEGVPMTKAACDALNGVYKGAIRCFGGICMGGTEAGESCASNDDCPSGTCQGSEEELTQLSPCPICDIADDAHCQNDPGEFAGTVYISDESVGGTDPAGTSRIADDFVALENGAINTVCVIGCYISFDGATHDCAGELPADPDSFTVSVYQNANSLPGTLVGSSATTVVARGLEFSDGFDFFRYKLSLTSPIAGLIGGNTYWIEVYNDTTDPPEACNWFWLNAAEQEGNSYFMQDLSASYGPEDAAVPLAGRPDASFCINLANEAPPEPVRACCSCSGGGGGVAGVDPNCADATFYECTVEQRQRWVFTQANCSGYTCTGVDSPANDECEGALALADGLNLGLTNRCANNSAPALDTVADCDGADTRFDSDVWYTYVSTCAGPLVQFDTCDQTNGAEDLLLAVYGGNDASCPCPATVGDISGCNDDGCFWGGTGSSVQVPTAVGRCFLLRVAGFFDDDGDEWEDVKLRVTCGVAAPFDAPGHGDNTCQTGGADTGLPCSTDADCVEPAECGLKSRYVSITPANPTVAGLTPSSIRVRVLTAPQFLPIVTHEYYAGPEISIPNAPLAALRGAPLQCTATPHSQVWTTGVLHLFGPSVVPTTHASGITTYAVAHCDATGGNCGPERNVEMAKWGDVVRPFTGAQQPNFGDINSIVQKFQNLATAPITPRADLVGTGNPGNPNTPNQAANFSDVSADVSAFGGAPYPYTVVACPP